MPGGSASRRDLRNTNAHLRLAAQTGLRDQVGSPSLDERGHRRSRIRAVGDISVGRARDLVATTVSGDCRWRVSGSEGRRVRSGTFGVEATSRDGQVRAGEVAASDADAPVQASSGSGDITVASTSGSADLRTASGSLTVGVADGLPAWLDLDSSSGEVRIALESTHQPPPGEAYVSVRATTASGDIAVYRA